MFFVALALPALALPHPLQAVSPAPAPAPGIATGSSVRWSIPGTVKDLARDAAGRILYCTAEREVGRMAPGAGRSVLGTAANFPNELRAVADSGGSVVTLDLFGHVRVLVGGALPPVWVYDDEYMILDASDLIVDGRGSFLVASATPSSGQRALNWIQADGDDWAYYFVKHQPVALAHDPLTGGILLSESSAGGNLRLVQAGSPIRATTALDTTTLPGLSAAQSDGDLAVTANGDVYWIAGGSVYLHTRAAGTTTLIAGGFGQLRGIAIASASPFFSGHTAPWSLYVAEGANPTRIREIGPAGAPASVVAADQGDVPGRGTRVDVTFGFQAYELTADNQGRLLLGGTNWGNPHVIKRVTLSGTPSIATVATTANGLAGVVEGLVVAPDDSFYALTRDGVIQHLSEGPLTVTTLFTDPGAQITAGKDLVQDVNGSFYVAARESWDFGKVLSISGGVVTLLTTTEETRGLAAELSGGLLFSQWHNTGFHGSLDLYRFGGSGVEALPGFAGMNYTNDYSWGDGDICVDAEGTIYTVSEDDWSLVRYHADLDGFERIGSGYLNHPSGLAIAPSTAGSGSTTGWSLYVAEFSNLYEIASVPAPAPTRVNSALGLTIGRTYAGSPHPGLGRPSALAPLPGGAGLLVGTALGSLLALDPATRTLQTLAGPEQGLRGRILALAASSDGLRILALNELGEVFETRAGRVRRLAIDPDRTAALVARFLASPQHAARLLDPLTGAATWFALEGWAVWRVTAAR